MALIVESGLHYEPICVKDDEGNEVKIGTAVYDLGDFKVRAELVKMIPLVEEIFNDIEKQVEPYNKDESEDKYGIPNKAVPILELNLTGVEKMIDVMDNVMGKGFCDRASGNSRNPLLIWEILGVVSEAYGITAQKEMERYTNRAQRRAGAKAGDK